MTLPHPASFLLLLALMMPATAQAERGDRILELPIHGSGAEGLQATGEVYRRYVSPPPGLLGELGPQRRVASFEVNYNPDSCPDGTTTPWTQEARDAFSYAVSIWAAILNANVTIEIDACWRNDLATNTLGSAGATAFARDFDNAPVASTRFPIALANQLAGEDLNGTDVEIDARFNSNFTWYFGTDGSTPAAEVDFVTVVLHEIGHGLGFSGGANYDDGTDNAECNGVAGNGCIGSPPRRYNQFVEDVNGTSILNYASPSIALGNVITSGSLFWDSTTANLFNGGQRVELFAPTTWNPGSSYSHLGQVFNGTEHALMTFALNNGEAIHYPGRVTLGILQDQGWDIRNTTSVIVDGSYTGSVQTGSPGNPFDTFAEGMQAVYPNGSVIVRPGSYDEQLTVIKAALIRGDGSGSVVIGRQ